MGLAFFPFLLYNKSIMGEDVSSHEKCPQAVTALSVVLQSEKTVNRREGVIYGVKKEKSARPHGRCVR